MGVTNNYDQMFVTLVYKFEILIINTSAANDSMLIDQSSHQTIFSSKRPTKISKI